MKLKHVFMTLGLASFMVLGVGAALNHKNEVRQAKADAPSWMFRVYLNERNYGDDLGLSNYRFHYWGDNADATVQLSLQGHNVVSNNFFAANVSLRSDQTITGCQFIATKSGADFYSNDIGFSLTNLTCDKMEYEWDIDKTTLESAKWSVTNDTPDTNATISIRYTNHDSADFVAEPANNIFAIRNFTIAADDGDGDKNINDRYLEFSSGVLCQPFLCAMLDDDSETSYMGFGSAHWISFKEYGTYDFIICGDSGFSGFRIHKHEDASASYIYYVSDSDSATNNKAYTFGGTEQLGPWPGTKITEIPNVEEVTRGLFHFQGNNVRIYKIPLNIGGSNDKQIIFNYNGASQSANLYLRPHTALWWSNQYNYTNDQAGLALDLIVRLESIRNAVTASGDVKAYSVCGISKANALSLVNEYKGLDSDTKVRYIDSSRVLTYKRDGTDGNEMVSYYDVMVELAKIAEVSLVPSNQISVFNANNAMLIIVITSIIGVSFVGMFFIIRRRRHN